MLKIAIPAAVVLLVSVWALNHTYRALVAARQDGEAAHLALTHQIVASEESRRALQADADTLLAQNVTLKAALEEAKAAAPGAKVMSAEVLKTGPIAVEAPEPAPDLAPALPPCPSNHYAPDGMGSFICQEKPGAAAPPKPVAQADTCMLRPGNKVSVELNEIYLRAAQGSRVLVGTASVWREDPPPRTHLVTGKLESAVSQVEEVQPPAEPRWGAELDGTCNRYGCGLGASVLLPPLGLWGFRLEPRLGALLGPDPAVVGGLGVRW